MNDPHGEYLAALAPEIRMRLMEVRGVMEAAVAGADRCIAYQMPALRKGRIVVYFAAFRRHIGIFPPVTTPPALVAELAPYAGPKGNLKFAHKDALPLEMIGRVGAALAAQYAR